MEAYNTVPSNPNIIYWDGPQFAEELLDHPAFGTGTDFTVKAKAVIRDSVSGKIIQEQPDSSSPQN